MEFQIAQDSIWVNVFAFGCLLLPLSIIIIVVSRKMAENHKVFIWLGALGVTMMCLIGMWVASYQDMAQKDASFSKQLMDEYGVTSSRSLHDIQLDFTRFDEARTVFTKDGKETPIFVKQIHSDDTQSEMAFTVIDDKALFPKANK